MIEYLRVSAPGMRDWRNLDLIERPAGLAWPWPQPARTTLYERMRHLFARLAGAIGNLPPDWREDRAGSRP